MLIYYLLLLIRGTRAVQIMLGLFVLVVILAVSNLLHLLVLATVMQYLLLGTAVTLPIVFQPELRRGLEQLGRGRLFVRDRRAEDDVAAEQIRDRHARRASCWRASAIGALIVVEQQTGLREYVESGTALDARLSLDLLLAIFTKSSPLHDGAVIVRDLLVEGAACFLPLSDNAIAVERHVGTRHRAAVGLTEQTDAVVVVVSEESGLVSVARAGRLSVPIDDEERLRRVLAACIRPTRRRAPGRGQPARQPAAGSRVLNLLRNNFGLKLLAVALAVVAWGYFHVAAAPGTTARFDQTLAVPIVVTGLQAGLPGALRGQGRDGRDRGAAQRRRPQARPGAGGARRERPVGPAASTTSRSRSSRPTSRSSRSRRPR